MPTLETVTYCLALLRGSGKQISLHRDTISADGIKVPGTVRVWQTAMTQEIPMSTESNWFEAAQSVASNPRVQFVDVATVIDECRRIRGEKIARAAPWSMVLPDGLTVEQEQEFARVYEGFVAGGEVKFPAYTAEQAVLNRKQETAAPQITVSDSHKTSEQGVVLPRVG